MHRHKCRFGATHNYQIGEEWDFVLEEDEDNDMHDWDVDMFRQIEARSMSSRRRVVTDKKTVKRRRLLPFRKFERIRTRHLQMQIAAPNAYPDHVVYAKCSRYQFNSIVIRFAPAGLKRCVRKSI